MKKNRLVLYIFLGLHLLLLSNLQFTAWPEMFSYPYLVNNGFSLYRDLVAPYPPLLILVLSGLFKMFGYKVGVLKVFTWILILATDLVLFEVLKKFFKKNGVVFLILGLYILLQAFLEGNMMWFDNALVLPVLLVFYNLISYVEKKDGKKLLFVGLFSTVAILIKQTAIIYLFISALIVLIIEKRKIKKVSKMFLFPLIGGLTFLGYLYISNNLTHFWNWSVYFPFKYWSKLSNYVDFDLSFSESRNLKLAFLLLLPFIITILKSKRVERVVVWFLLASLIAIYPRFSYFHLQPAIVFFVILVAFGINKMKKKLKFLFFILSLGILILIIKPFYLINWRGSDRFVDDLNKNVLEKLELEKKEETVFLMGSYSNYYVFSDVLPPKPWLDNFNWHYEILNVQEETISSFDENPPGAVYIDKRTNYLPQQIVSWVFLNYNLDETIEGSIEIWRKN